MKPLTRNGCGGASALPFGAPHSICPEGTNENSPAFQRWGRGPKSVSPEGTAASPESVPARQPFLRTSLGLSALPLFRKSPLRDIPTHTWTTFRQALVLALLLLVAGCGHRSAPVSETEPALAALPQFSAKKGLLLPDQTKRALGLKTVEVAERKIAPVIEVRLRVYEASGETVLASGSIEPGQGKQLAQGRPVEVISGSTPMPGKILHVDQQTRAATSFDELLVQVPNARELLSVGSFVSARVQAEPKEGVVAIPRAAVLRCTEGQFVYTVSGDHLVRTAVKLGASDKDWVEVTDGLYAGDQVVTEPVMSLWLTELAAVKGGQACCAAPPKGK